MKKDKQKPAQMFSSEDTIQKTWIPEGTKEYAIFKLITQENKKLVEVIKKHVDIKPGDLVLDVGGRDGNVAFDVQEPKWVHIIDPDPTIKLLKQPGKFWNEKVQNVSFNSKQKYKLIICCHVLGYLGLQDNAQEATVKKLLELLEVGGTLILFYNTNIGYMKELLDYSRHVLSSGHYDYFQEQILSSYRNTRYNIKHLDATFSLDYKTWDELARCCWFLFGVMDSDIEGSAKKFLPKLQNDLIEPTFMIEERMVFVTKQADTVSMPSLR